MAANRMATDTELVDFPLADSELTGVPGVVIDGSFVPVVWSNFGQPPVDPIPGRMLIVVLTAIGGTNTNYGLGTDSGVSATFTVANKGTLRHRQVTTNTDVDGPAWWTITTPAGQVRCAFHVGTYPATGSIAFTGGAKPSLGVAAQGTIEFICRAETPAGTTATFQARVNGGDAWVTVQDGQAPADVGLAVPNPVAYEMQCLLTANATQDATPTVRAIGILDRLVTDVTEIASLSGFTESVDPMSAEVKMADGECRLCHTGARDYRDIATRLVTEIETGTIQHAGAGALVPAHEPAAEGLQPPDRPGGLSGLAGRADRARRTLPRGAAGEYDRPAHQERARCRRQARGRADRVLGSRDRHRQPGRREVREPPRRARGRAWALSLRGGHSPAHEPGPRRPRARGLRPVRLRHGGEGGLRRRVPPATTGS